MKTKTAHISRLLAHLATAAIAMSALSGCRGSTFTQAPVHPNPNMDNVTFVEAQEPSLFFADGRGMRLPPAGTVARGELREDDHTFRGVVNGTWATTVPDSVLGAYSDDEGVPALSALAARGQERYGIYCTPCHGEAGLENGGIVPRRGADGGLWSWNVPSLHGERQRGFTVGQLYHIITDGINTMPGYAAQVPVDDRWAIAAYVRALQISQAAPIEVVPAPLAQSQGWNR